MKKLFTVLYFLLLSTGWLRAQSQTARLVFNSGNQTWAVPTGVTSVTIEARGAEGGIENGVSIAPGKGAIVAARLAVTPGQSLSILVGAANPRRTNGGGGSFVVGPGLTPLVIAGGGGGGGDSETNSDAKHGQLGLNGGGPAGGMNGQGGGSDNDSGGGGGLLSDGGGMSDGSYVGPTGGKAFVNGGGGGAGPRGLGGFGGGGGSGSFAGGGGGGYSGGSGGSGASTGGGGSSFTAGTRLFARTGATEGNSGNGVVIISYQCPGFIASLTSNGQLTCATKLITLTAGGGEPGATYQFSTGATPNGAMATVTNEGPYSVTVTNPSGCSSTATTTVMSSTSAPTVSITPSSTAVCAGQSVTLAVNATTSGGTLSYRWNTSATTPSILVNATGPYSVSVTRSDNGCVATATASVTVTPLLSAPQVALTTYCQGQPAGPLSVTASPGGSLRYYTSASGGTPFNSIQPSTATAGTTTYYVSQVNAQGCESNRVALPVTVAPLPSAPSLVTQSGYPYPAGVSSLSISQNVGPVSLTAIGCLGGMIMASGNAASSLTITTAMTGTQTYTATCTLNGCTSPVGSFQLTVLPTTLSVLHQDVDYGQTQDQIIKPFLKLANAGGQPVPYGELTVRYWFTSEGNSPPTDFQVYYAQLGAVTMKYVPLAQPRQGAFGYVEYSFPGGGSLPANGNSGPIENGILKKDRSNFNETDDYSYQPNRDYLPNTRITAYRKGADGVPVIVWGQEPTPVASQTAVQVYSAAKDGGITSQIQTRLELRNTGNVALPVSALKLRYYFTSDNNQTANVYVDYADLGASNVQARVVRLPSPVNGADSYVELSFPGNPRQLGPLSSLGVIDFRLVRSDFGLLNQGNDYSYAPIYGPVGLNARVTAYLDNTLLFGTPPSGAPARVGAPEPMLALQVKVLGNPVVGSQAAVEITGVVGQAVTLKVVDLQGRAIYEQRIEQAGELEQVSLPLGSSRGLLLLKVSTASQQQSLKLLRP